MLIMTKYKEHAQQLYELTFPRTAMKSFSVTIRTFSKGLLTFAADLRVSRHSDLSQLAQATVIGTFIQWNRIAGFKCLTFNAVNFSRSIVQGETGYNEESSLLRMGQAILTDFRSVGILYRRWIGNPFLLMAISVADARWDIISFLS